MKFIQEFKHCVKKLKDHKRDSIKMTIILVVCLFGESLIDNIL